MILSILLSDFITLTGDLFVLYRLMTCFYSRYPARLRLIPIIVFYLLRLQSKRVFDFGGVLLT